MQHFAVRFHFQANEGAADISSPSYYHIIEKGFVLGQSSRERPFRPIAQLSLLLGLHMGKNNLCYVTHHFLFFPFVPMSLFIRS